MGNHSAWKMWPLVGFSCSSGLLLTMHTWAEDLVGYQKDKKKKKAMELGGGMLASLVSDSPLS